MDHYVPSTSPEPRTENEGTLVSRLRGGDTSAIEGLYSIHGRGLYGLAYRLTNSRPDAEEIVQDVFVGLPLALRGYAEQGAFGAWLRRIAARLSIDRVRRSSRRREVGLTSAHNPSVSSGAGGVDAREALERALATLPDALRSVFVLKEVEGYSHSEIADLLGIRRGTSEVRLLRAIRRLRQELEDDR
jgi:RNA polymerase sigma-70 factor (ECF subfamily)